MKLRGQLIVFYGLTGLMYLIWRLVMTMAGAPLVLSIPFFGAEVFLFLTGLAFYLLLPERGADTPEAGPPVEGAVDVLIPTFSESVDLVRLTVLAALQIRGETRVHLLDDGRRPEMQALADELGVAYRTRANNHSFKAGNLNAALADTDAPFVLVLDADHLARPEFLERTLGHFAQERVAFVQVPQRYYNTDSFQHPVAGGSWHESTVFHERLQVGADRLGATILVGTGCVLRRSALDQIGGFATESVTEDVLTSMKLHALGYQGRYVREPIAFLTAPDSTLAWCSQRLRWAQGAMQIVRRSNPITLPGLTMTQRLAYVSALSSFASGWATLLLHLAPGLYLLTGLAPVSVDATVILPILLAHLAVDMGTHYALAWPDARWFATERYRAVQIPIQIRAALRLILPDGARFLPTPKGAHRGLPRFVVFGLLALVLFHGVAAVWGGWMVLNEMGNMPAIVFATVIAVWFGIVSTSALRHVLQRRGTVDQAAMPTAALLSLKVGESTVEVRLVRATPDRVVLRVPRSLRKGTRVTIEGLAKGVVEQGGHECRILLDWPDAQRRLAFSEQLYLRPAGTPLTLGVG